MGILEDLKDSVDELVSTLKQTIAIARGDDAGGEDAAPEAPAKRTRGKKAAAKPAKDDDDDGATLEDIRAALKVLLDNGDNATVKKLLKKHGGTKASDVPEENYDALLADAEKAGGTKGGDDGDDLL